MTTPDSVTLAVTMAVTVRLARHDDLPKLEWYGQYRHFRVLYQRSFREQEAGRRLMLVADSGGFPVGHIFISLRPGLGGASPYAYFYAFRVMEMLRGLGIGKFLLDHAESAAIKHAYQRAVIAVAKDNTRAQALYERRGYAVYAEDAGRWSYPDHEGVIRHVSEPCWLLEKRLYTG
jgi:ribosomal protein S18 acetylase RimI-like enzyme